MKMRAQAQTATGGVEETGLKFSAGAVSRLGARTSLSTVRTDNAPKVRFSATLSQEPEVKLALV